MRIGKLVAALVLAFAPTLSVADVSCRVVGVSDGDTLTCLTAERKQLKVRLGEIDTPEKAQPYGQKAKQALSNLVFGKTVTLKTQTTDRYGRTVARVYVGGLDVNREMVSQGAAWVYRQYNRDRSLLAVEAEAKAAQRGLWVLPEAERMPPWEWRKAGRNANQAATKTLASSAAFQCGAKRYCKQMTSCEEARYHLTQCGVGSLDGDKDGMPCENLCR
jgi:endonuclease YncB( thermonuclease family)